MLVALYSVILIVVVGSCATEYLGVRLLSPLPVRKQTWLGAASLGICGLALVGFRSAVVVTDCFVLVVALFAGLLLSRQIGSLGALATMLVVASITDLISSHAGISRWLVDQARQGHGVTMLQFLAVSVRAKQKLVPIIGVSDLMFFTICVSVTRRLGWPEAWTLMAPLAGLLAALAVGLFAGFTPALPFMATAVLLCAYVSRSSRQAPCHG